MVRGARMATAIDMRQALVLSTWFSPAYPVSAYAYSQGLEWAVAEARVTSAVEVEAWARASLTRGAAWIDAVLLATAQRVPPNDLAEIDDLGRALAPGAERARETAELGAAFARTTAAAYGTDPHPWCYPVAVGAAARALGLDGAMVLQHFLLGSLGALVSAAQRLVPLGQTEAQQITAALLHVIGETVPCAQNTALAELGVAAMAADLASLSHEFQDVRLYRS